MREHDKDCASLPCGDPECTAPGCRNQPCTCGAAEFNAGLAAGRREIPCWCPDVSLAMDCPKHAPDEARKILKECLALRSRVEALEALAADVLHQVDIGDYMDGMDHDLKMNVTIGNLRRALHPEVKT